MIASGLTVIAALLTMLAAVFGIYRTLGPINAMGIAVVLLAGLTLLPALLRLLGRRVYWPNERSVEPAPTAGGGRGGARWRAVALRVRRHPARFLAASVALLVSRARPGSRSGRRRSNPLAQFRTQTDSKQGYEILAVGVPARRRRTPRPSWSSGRRAASAPAMSTRSRSGSRPSPASQSVTDTGRRSSDGRAGAAQPRLRRRSVRGGRARPHAASCATSSPQSAPTVRVLVGGGSAERLDLRNAARRDLKVVVPLALARGPAHADRAAARARGAAVPARDGGPLVRGDARPDDGDSRVRLRPGRLQRRAAADHLHLPRRARLGLQHLPDESRARGGRAPRHARGHARRLSSRPGR